MRHRPRSRIRSSAAALLVPGLVAWGGGCGVEGGEGSTDPPELVVSAASDLRFAFPEIAEAFHDQTGTRVTFNFGSTGNLARQIERGAPVDVFAAADPAFVDPLMEGGQLDPATRGLYAEGFLVVLLADEAASDPGVTVDEVGDLADPRVGRIAVANPEHAPYGRAAREALVSAGIWEEIQGRVVLAGDVSQALEYVRTGNVGAGLVALSLVSDGPAASGGHLRVPSHLHAPIEQVLGVSAGSRRPEEARAFADFVLGPTGRSILERYGFRVPEPPSADGSASGEGSAAEQGPASGRAEGSP